MPQLPRTRFLAFPLRIFAGGGELASRARHVRDLIEQVLFTHPGERVFRNDFGAGIRNLTFEPNSSALAEVTRQRLLALLAETLRGEVDPRSLTVAVENREEQLVIGISYTLAAVGFTETQEFTLGRSGAAHG